MAREHPGLIVWLTGLSGAGKTTICNGLLTRLAAEGFQAEVLDGDLVRSHLCPDLGFSKEDRDENIRRIGFVAELLARHNIVVLVGAISPYRQAREKVRKSALQFLEVYVNAPLSLCERRDVKGLYGKARRGILQGLTGIDDPYEAPLTPEVECRTADETVEESVAKVYEAIVRTVGIKE